MRLELLRMPWDQEEVLSFIQQAVAGGRHGLSENKHALVERDDGREGLGLVARVGRRIVGYAGMAPARAAGVWAVELVCPPERAVAMIDGAARLLGRRGVATVRWWVYDEDLRRIPRFLGFAPERDLLLMGRPLPGPGLEPVEEIDLRAFRPGRDEETWIELNNRSFADHRENGAVTVKDLERRMGMPWFDPGGLRMAWMGERAVGFCWTKIHPGATGEIYIVGADPSHQGRGLGRLLVTEGMRHLSERGCDRIILYTDGDNLPAIRLYRSLGFEVEATYRTFLRSI